MTWPAIVLYTTIAAGDLGSTEWGIKRGAHEGNPLLRDRGVRIVVKSVQPVALGLIERKIESKCGKKLFRVGAAIMGGIVIGRNIKIGIEAEKARKR